MMEVNKNKSDFLSSLELGVTLAAKAERKLNQISVEQEQGEESSSPASGVLEEDNRLLENEDEPTDEDEDSATWDDDDTEDSEYEDEDEESGGWDDDEEDESEDEVSYEDEESEDEDLEDEDESDSWDDDEDEEDEEYEESETDAEDGEIEDSDYEDEEEESDGWDDDDEDEDEDEEESSSWDDDEDTEESEYEDNKDLDEDTDEEEETSVWDDDEDTELEEEEAVEDTPFVARGAVTERTQLHIPNVSSTPKPEVEVTKAQTVVTEAQQSSVTIPTPEKIKDIPPVVVTPNTPSIQKDAIPEARYERGMTLLDFLRVNPQLRSKKVVLQYFSLAELNSAYRKGLVTLKNDKIVI